MGNDFWREGFGPMLEGTHQVPFGELPALEETLLTRKVAAVVLEPIQAEEGIVLPPAGYLAGVEKLCAKYGSLFCSGRSADGDGTHRHVPSSQPLWCATGMIVMAKALSGGLVPIGAVLMTDAIYRSAFHPLRRAFIHTSTFSENAMAMRVALATVEVLIREHLVERSDRVGTDLRRRLSEALKPYEMVKEVCGQAPRSMRLRVSFEAFKAIHPGLFGQMLVMRLFNQKNVLTQICGNNFMVLKVAAPTGRF
jgi:ornithine--oxo-acid transaminase